MPGKQCIVSFADNVGSYKQKLERLKQSLKHNFEGDVLAFTDYASIGSPTHQQIPYAFKAYAIQKAIDLGYNSILWCDSPLWAVKSVQPIFDYIDMHGYIFFDNIGHPFGMWANDKTLKYFGIDRDESFRIKQIMGCCMGFAANYGDKFRGITPMVMFNQYKELAAELFPGDWSNDDLTESTDKRVRGHRHDQSVMSAIIHKYDKKILKGQDTFFAYYSHKEVMPVADSVCLYSG